jgi:Uma2 family endonuclease
MAMRATHSDWTVDVLDALPDDGNRYELYLLNGIPEYWIVNAKARTVARWRAGQESAELLTARLVWHLDGISSPRTIDLPEFFDDALG